MEEKSKLEELILIEKKSYEDIGKIYNCSGSNIKKVALRLGIKLQAKRKINKNETFNKGISKYPRVSCINCGCLFIKYPNKGDKYCSQKCQREYEHKSQYKLIIDGDPSIMRADYSPKAFKKDILEEQKYKCAICGISNI